MAIPAARVAGTTIFLTATFDRTAEEGHFFDGPEISPILDDGPGRLFSLIEKEKSRAIVSAAA
jgi:hypothetical protein